MRILDNNIVRDMTPEEEARATQSREQGYTAEQLAEMTNAELSASLADMGISTDMDKNNMIDLILYKQKGADLNAY